MVPLRSCRRVSEEATSQQDERFRVETETQQSIQCVFNQRNSLAATRPGVRKDRLSRDVIIIIVPPFASRDLVFATNQGAVAPIRERSLPPNQTCHMT